MTEQEAIERIAKAFKHDAPGCSDEYLTARAITAWAEVKAMARDPHCKWLAMDVPDQ